MKYSETCEYLYHQLPMFERQGAGAYKEGLENTLALDEHFGHPHRQYRTIHIAGTNGKGSCAHTLSAILQMCGYKVGLYTSPHLVDFSERIRINGEPIDENYIVDFVEKEKNFFEPLQPTFFELATSIAFKYFADNQVDIAVIEVGLGGRLDCTNIIMPILSVITNIGMDHTDLLGDTLEQIATEKAGIIKKDVPVVIGETTPSTRMVFQTIADEMQTNIFFAEDQQEVIEAKPAGHGMLYKTQHYGTIEGELGGIYQERNANTILAAVRALEALGFMYPGKEGTTNREVWQGFKHVCKLTGLKGRWQVVNESPLTVCDTGHNVPAWIYLSQQLKEVKCRKKHIIFGMVDDKDVEGVMALLPKDAVYYLTKSDNKRSVSENVLKVYATALGLEVNCYSDVAEAYHAAKSAATDEDFMFIGGSSYIVADFLKIPI